MNKKIEVFIFCLLALCLLAFFVLATDLECSIVTNTSCLSPNISILYVENESGGYDNAHAQNVSVSVPERYNYAVCCGSTEDEITTNCKDGIFLILSNETNAHIQQAQIDTYNFPVCMSATTGTVTCSYSTSCSGSQTCVGSMASSELVDNNQTNAHFGSCNEYETKICCTLNNKPEITTPVLTSTWGTNRTTENLTVYTTPSDIDGDNVTLIYNWYRNNKSLTLLNMPFESSNATWTKDYSPYNNNGDVNGATWDSTAGWNSTGAYEFNGVNNYINCGNDLSLNYTDATYSVWAYVKDTKSSDHARIIDKGAVNYNTLRLSNGKVYTRWDYGGATSYASKRADTVISENEWHHLAVVHNVTAKTVILYIDGSEPSYDVDTDGTDTKDTYGSDNLIISGGSSYPFNGTIDSVQIWNRSLSAEQVKALYTNRTDRIVSQETAKGEIWNVRVTPNDGIQDGDTKASNNLTILNSAPEVTLVSPEDNNLTTNRTPEFTWSGADNDTDSLTYTLNLTCFSTLGGGCSDNREIGTGSSESYTLTSDLLYLKDNNYYYNWTVRAHDGTTYSSWATPRRIDIAALIDITMVNDTIDFGNINISIKKSDNTTDNDPCPLIIRNDGNSFVNVTVNATKLWEAGSFPSDNYQFKIDNTSSESGSFNWLQSLVSWTQMGGTTTMAIVELNYSDNKDEAEIDIHVNVPPSEPAGDKFSIINFTASLGE